MESTMPVGARMLTVLELRELALLRKCTEASDIQLAHVFSVSRANINWVIQQNELVPSFRALDNQWDHVKQKLCPEPEHLSPQAHFEGKLQILGYKRGMLSLDSAEMTTYVNPVIDGMWRYYMLTEGSGTYNYPIAIFNRDEANIVFDFYWQDPNISCRIESINGKEPQICIYCR